MTPRIVRGWIEKLFPMSIEVSTLFESDDEKIHCSSQKTATLVSYIQRENDSAKSSTENDFNRTPLLSSENIQITSKGYARQKIREEHIDGTCNNQLVEHGPVGDIALAEMHDILPKQTERSKS